MTAALAEMSQRVVDLSATNAELQEAARALALTAARNETPPGHVEEVNISSPVVNVSNDPPPGPSVRSGP